MLIPVPPSDCMRARETVSLQLDDELAELERARLDLHLRSCAACREFAAGAGAITDELRRAPLERPAQPVLVTSRSPRIAALRTQVAAAAVIAVSVAGSLVLGKMVGGGGGGGAAARFTASAPSTDLAGARQDAIEQHLLALLPVRRQGILRNGPVVPL